MSVTVAQLVAQVSVQGAAEAKAELQGMATATDEASGGMKGMLGNALSFAAGQAVFMAVGQAIGFVKNQISDSITLAIAQQQIMSQTNAVLKSTGDVSGMSAQAIANLADSLSQVTTFSEPTIQSAENLLLTFTNIGKNVFPQATTATLNMAQSMHEDLQSAALQVGKALDNPLTGMTALSREGVTFTASQKAAVAAMMATGNTAGAQKIILQELQREFGGSAVAAGSTFGGQLQILQNKLDDTKEKIGAALLPVLGQLMGYVSTNLMPVLAGFSGWLTGTAIPNIQKLGGFLTGTLIPAFQNAGSGISKFMGGVSPATPILAGLGAVLAVVLVPAIWSLAAGVIAATWPFLAIAVAVAGAVAIFEHFYNTSAPFRTFINNVVDGLKQAASFVQANFLPAIKQIGAFLQANVLPILQQVGSFIVAQFLPVWKQLQQLWQSQLMPLFGQLGGALKQMTPLFQLLGAILGGIVAVQIGMVIGLISGLARGISFFVEGLANAITGVIRVFTGISQVVGGVVQFVVDLCTGKFGKLGADLGQIWQGIINIFSGAWQIIAGIFQAAWGLVSGIVTGFVQGIIGFFKGLYNDLVGHSIIPDMINGVVSWFEQLPGRVGSAIVSMVSSVTSKLSGLLSSGLSWAGNFVSRVFNALGQLAGKAGSAIGTMTNTVLSDLGKLAGQALQAGANIVQQIAQGIIGAIGSAIGGAMTDVGNFISSHLPHSPAKMGPLRDLALQGSLIPDQIARGITQGMPALQTSLNLMVPPHIVTNAISTTVNASSASGAGQQVILQIDGRTFARGLLPHLTNEIRYGTGVKF